MYSSIMNSLDVICTLVSFSLKDHIKGGNYLKNKWFQLDPLNEKRFKISEL